MFEKALRGLEGQTADLHFADPLCHFRSWLWGFIPGTMMPKWDFVHCRARKKLPVLRRGRGGGLATSGDSSSTPKINQR